MRKYLGLSLLLAWHYCLWFVPKVLFHTPLLADTVTCAWLIGLVASALTMLLLPIVIGRKRHLLRMAPLRWVVPIVVCLGTVCLCFCPQTLANIWLSAPASVLVSAASALMWLMWGEQLACLRSNFTIKHVGPVFGLTILAALVATTLLPHYLSGAVTALLPLASGVILAFAERRPDAQEFPPLLLRQATRQGLRPMIIVCLISFVASIACYFLVAIIDWQALPFLEQAFSIGVVGGALFMLLLAAMNLIPQNRYNIFRMFPWLLVLLVVAFALFLTDVAFDMAAFVVALAIASVFELLLMMYFGLLTGKGYVAPALAFGLSGGCIRLGIAIGNGWAIYYETQPELAQAVTNETAFVFICLLMGLLIPLVRQEYSIAALTSAPPSASTLSVICGETAQEFGLSEREADILRLIAHGYTSATVAQKLVISPYTVNTHIQHIYEKMQIHKRSELLNYLNMQRGDL
jgi:DNA-binding CsgD family transcriptional regulator